MPSLSKKNQWLQQIAADLRWISRCPSLVQGNAWFLDDVFFDDRTDIVQAFQDNPAAHATLVNRIFSQGKPRVGDYFERVMLLWLHLNPRFTHILQHIRIHKGKHTLGELDFLFHDRQQGVCYHWEVAVKYFLCFASPENVFQFLGPNAKDTLTRKYDRMINHQVPLSRTAEARQIIQPYCKSLPLRAKAVLKGMLFYPAKETPHIPENFQAIISPQHRQGWWTSMQALTIPPHTPDSRWMVMQKPFWFQPVSPHYQEHFDLAGIERLVRSHFAQSDRALLLAELVQAGNHWQEVSRGIIVSSTWPAVKSS